MSRSLGDEPSLVTRYVLPPAEIEHRSLALVAAALTGLFADDPEREVAGRIAYAAGDLSILASLRFQAGAVAAGVAALRVGAPVIADVRMLIAGLDRVRLDELGCPVYCAIDAPEVADAARASGLPRAVEAMRTFAPQLNGSIVAIGNAPTALFALLDLVDGGSEPPALILGLPVGFVAAAEAKAELASRSLPFVTLLGTRGGSAFAAAAANALLRLATRGGDAG